MHVRGSGGNIVRGTTICMKMVGITRAMCGVKYVSVTNVITRAGKRGMREGWVSSWQRKNII